MSTNQIRWQDYKSHLHPIWCPGCGHFGVLNGIYQALAKLQIPHHMISFISGIGCSSRIPGYTKTYGFNTIHGRAIPIASGVKIANPDLKVIVATGDGDCMAIGTGHFPHTAKRNVDITVIMMDNGIYGLTKGQTSPTSPLNLKTKSAPFGNPEVPLNPILFAMAFNSSFVARSFSGNIPHLTEIIAKAIEHKGFSFIQVLSPCVTYRGKELFSLYKEICKPLPEDYNQEDRMSAYKYAEDEETLWIGIFYKKVRETLEERFQKISEIAKKVAPKEKEEILKRFLP